jgi:hypothetical protein
VRVQALAVAAGAVTVTALGHVPVVVAVGGIAGLAESCIVVESGGVDLGEGQGRPERLEYLLGPAGVDGVAVAVFGSDALEDEMPVSWLTVQQEGTLLSGDT